MGARRAAARGVQPEKEAGPEDLGAEQGWSPDGDLGTQEKVALSCDRQERPGCPQGPGEELAAAGTERPLCGEASSWREPAVLLGPARRRRKRPRSRRCLCPGPSAESAQGSQRGKVGPWGGALPTLVPGGHLGTGFVLGARPRPSETETWAGRPRRDEGRGGGAGGQRSRSGLPAAPREGSRERRGGTPPLAAPRPRRPPAPPGSEAGAPRARAPPPQNQTGPAASQPIGEETGEPRPMGVANANEL